MTGSGRQIQPTIGKLPGQKLCRNAESCGYRVKKLKIAPNRSRTFARCFQSDRIFWMGKFGSRGRLLSIFTKEHYRHRSEVISPKKKEKPALNQPL
ncbi:hypothetical protein J6590_099923 [Homalodisca vitripennis]|nr:hypothetical protein J6590_099923 [Homalodisca vitripennis]